MNTHIFKQSASSVIGKLLSVAIGFVLTAIMVTALSSLVFADEGPADIEMPSDVEGLVATPGDSVVNLSWDVAMDNVGVEGYKVYYGTESVTAEGGSYLYTLEVGDVIEYEVEDLVNTVAYYFAVTAYDAAGNESESYSFEVEAIPMPGEVEEDYEPVPMGDDGASPTVKSAEGYSNVQIKVTFSEDVVLPEDEPQTAFLVEDNLTGEFLPLLDAEVLNEDNRVVILETAPQDSATEYILTAGITIEDTYGNSVRSGTSDTATFLGGEGDYVLFNVEVTPEPGFVEEVAPLTEEDYAAVEDLEALEDSLDELEALTEELDMLVEELEEELPEEVLEEELVEEVLEEESAGVVLDEEDLEPEILELEEAELPEGLEYVEAISETEVEIMFSEPVTLLEADTHFVVSEDTEGLISPILPLVSEELLEDGQTVVLTLDDMEPGHDYTLSIMNVVTASGAAIDSGEGIEFEAMLLELADLIPPEEITELMSHLEGALVRLTWMVSVSEDAIEQIVYESVDGENYVERVILPPLVSELELNDLVAGVTYWFKITSKDAAGNESEGVVIEVTLPETGPGLALMFGISALGTAAVRRRKRS